MSKKRRALIINAWKIAFILVAAFLIVYVVTVLSGSFDFFNESAKKNAILATTWDPSTLIGIRCVSQRPPAWRPFVCSNHPRLSVGVALHSEDGSGACSYFLDITSPPPQ